jgi:isoleucyl-tRNA synthetase
VAISNYSERELDILKRWQEQDIFNKTLAQTAQGKRFIFFEGPPTANGMPHIGHAQGRAFKDVICRYKTMRGFFVERKAGWDTQGLPVELEVEKQLKVSGKRDIEKYGIAKFNQACRDSVWKYTAEWKKLTERIGYWLDMEHPYITYEKPYIETLWWIFKQIWDKGLLIKDYKVVPQCPRCGTALSSHEVAQGYERVTDNAITVKFELVDEPGTFILAWTTTPWTLPGNVALAVGKDILYVKTNPNEKGERYVIASERYINSNNKPEILVGDDYSTDVGVGGVIKKGLENLTGAELIGKKYKPLFNNAVPKQTKGYDNAYKVYAADFVTTDEGTGIVHTAVMYGEDDYQLGEKIGLPKIHTVTPDGKFNELVPKWAGWPVKHKDKTTEEKTTQAIIDDLKSRGLLYKAEAYTHDYPFCWRCHTPLLYYAKDSWFIKMSALREKLLANNEQINWIPEYIKHGRFGEWLAEVKDWAVSRERYWGTPLPIWECTNKPACQEKVCIGSYEELNKLASRPLDKDFDPHRPFIDDVILTCQKCGGSMKRVPEVADAWFDSGCMPFAQWHYPFENQERIDKGLSYPADYISEAIDQTRGWFYTLLAIATVLGKETPYRNVICQAHVMDAKGKKMSKHIGNVTDPNKAIEEFGADTVRWFFLTTSQPGESKNYDPKSLTEIVRKNFMLLSNVLSFFKLYAGENKVTKKTPHLLDQWIMDLTYQLVDETTTHLDNYRITEAGRGITKFIDDLSTWYLRRSRDRFKDADQRDQAVDTLRHVLQILAKLLAPFAPFYADDLYQQTGGQKASVHLEAWPKLTHQPESDVLQQMATVRSVAETTHSLRSEAGIKVRQPLGNLVVTGAKLSKAFVGILSDEVNILKVRAEDELPSGPEWKIKMIGGIGIAINITITTELAAQGMVRELVRQTNSVRKQAGLTINDQVELYLQSDPSGLLDSLRPYLQKIKSDTLSREAHLDKLPADSQIQGEFKVEGGLIRIAIVK